MFCKFCGVQVGDSSKFCPSCGKQLDDTINETVVIQENAIESKKKKRLKFIAAMGGLFSSVILFLILFVFSTTTDLYSAIEGGDIFYVNVFDFTYLCVESVDHLVAFIAIIIFIALSILSLAKPRWFNILMSCGYALCGIVFLFSLFNFTNFCFFIPALPVIGIMLCSAILMIISSVGKK